jgi:hypothetical protein
MYQRSRIIESVADLIDAVRGSDLPTRPLWYRGQRDSTWSVAPSIARSGYGIREERNVTHRFRTRAGVRYREAPEYDDYPGWLSLMQHYGLPTRLLDWSRSPLIAAYFAVEAHLPPYEGPTPVHDAAIWVLAPHVLNQMLANHDVTPAINSSGVRPVIQSAFLDVPAGSLSRPIPAIVAVMASEIDMRMFVQQGCFTAHSSGTSVDSLESSPEFLEQLVVPAERIVEFAAEIDACGITQGDIFPDLEHLAAELRHSVPRGRQDWTKSAEISGEYADEEH